MASYSAPVRRLRGKKGEERTLSDHYWVRITDGTHRTWRSTGKSTEKLAEQVRKTWELQDAKGERHVDTKTFSEAADAWLEEKKDKGIAKTTAAVFGVYVRAWSRHWGKKPIRSVATDHVERYLKLRSGKLAPRSLNNERKRLVSFFKWCGKRGWHRGNPAADVGAYQEEKKTIRTLSEDEERRLLEEARAGGEDLYGFTLCLLASGLRRGTVAALEWRDIDWAAGEWRIPARKMKSREDFTGRPIDPELLEYLKARRRPAGSVFGPLDREKWQAAASRAGLEVTPHAARRTFITRCRRRGVPMEVCMFLSDHRSLEVVLKSYRSVGAEEARKALEMRAEGKAGAGVASR